MPRALATVALAIAALFSGPGGAGAQEAEEPVPAPESSKGPTNSPSGVIPLVGREAAIYYDDAKALFFAPFHWNGTEIRTAVGAGAVVGTVIIFDQRLARVAQERATEGTNHVANVLTPFGTYGAFAASGALIVAGVSLRDGRVTSMGREGIEACFIAGLMTTIAKPVFGRERTGVSDKRTAFKPFSGNNSFPSGHATVAFALASVVSARSDGWVVPTVAYALASLVAYSRVNDAAHFPSDVVAGGLIGATTGRFIVHRHRRAEAGAAPPKAEFSLIPIHNGLAIAARF